MRRVIAQTFLSLDGVMEAPDKWQLPNDLFNDERRKFVGEDFESSDALLLGRVTYQGFAGFWPTQSEEDPFAKTMNSITKFVVSTTLKTLEWKNSRLVKGNVTDEVSKLKQQPGRDILIIGSAQLVNGLTPHGLIDEYHLLIHPIIVGRGKRLFKDGIDPTLMKLVDTRTFATGVVGLSYQRTGKAALG